MYYIIIHSPFCLLHVDKYSCSYLEVSYCNFLISVLPYVYHFLWWTLHKILYIMRCWRWVVNLYIYIQHFDIAFVTLIFVFRPTPMKILLRPLHWSFLGCLPSLRPAPPTNVQGLCNYDCRQISRPNRNLRDTLVHYI